MEQIDFAHQVRRLKERWSNSYYPDDVLDMLYEKVKRKCRITFREVIDRILFNQKTPPTCDAIYQDFCKKERWEEAQKRSSLIEDDDDDPVPFTEPERKEMAGLMRHILSSGGSIEEQKQQIAAMCKVARNRHKK